MIWIWLSSNFPAFIKSRAEPPPRYSIIIHNLVPWNYSNNMLDFRAYCHNWDWLPKFATDKWPIFKRHCRLGKFLVTLILSATLKCNMYVRYVQWIEILSRRAFLFSWPCIFTRIVFIKFILRCSENQAILCENYRCDYIILVFWYQNCSALLWEKNVLVI